MTIKTNNVNTLHSNRSTSAPCIYLYKALCTVKIRKKVDYEDGGRQPSNKGLINVSVSFFSYMYYYTIFAPSLNLLSDAVVKIKKPICQLSELAIFVSYSISVSHLV